MVTGSVRPDAARSAIGHRPWLTQRRREAVAGVALAAPDLLGLTVFVLIPVALSLTLGLFDVSGFGAYTFVGAANYVRMLSDPLFLGSLRVTLIYVGLFVPGLFCVSLALAVLVWQRCWGVGLWRTLLFAPNATSLVVVALVWRFVLADNIGVANQLTKAVGVGNISWLGTPSLALLVVVGISVWAFMGFYMLIFLGGLQDIPSEYFEAARIDGAGALPRFRHVIWPMLRPTSFFVLLMSAVIGLAGLQSFDLIYVLTKGGPANSTALGIFYIYQQAFQYNEYGYAAAMASVYVAIMAVFTAGVFAVTRGGRFHAG